MQATLFNNPKLLARRENPESSHIAAEKIIDSNALSLHEAEIIEVLEHYKDDKNYYGYWKKYYDRNPDDNFAGMTFREISECCYLSEPQIWRRLKGLESKGKLKRGIMRVCTVSGNQCTEWSVI